MQIQLLVLLTLPLLLLGCGDPSAATSTESVALESTSLESTWVAEVASSDLLSRGSFEGRSDHVVTGDVRLVQSGQETFVLLGEDFTLDGAPDPKLGFGTDGNYDTTSTFTVLKHDSGAQAYRIPDSLDLSGHNELVLWCDQFSVPLGVASLK